MLHDENYIIKKALRIIDELKLPRYLGQSSKIKCMHEKLENTIFVISEYKSDVLRLETLNGKVITEFEYSSPMSGYVFSYPPVYVNNQYEEIKPILKVLENVHDYIFDCVLYHELSHLFSIGEIKQSDSGYRRILGLADERYDMNFKTKQDLNAYLGAKSDMFNDWVAKKLYEKIEGKEYEIRSSKYIQFHSRFDEENVALKVNFEHIIGDYFNNDIEGIIKRLSKI